MIVQTVVRRMLASGRYKLERLGSDSRAFDEAVESTYKFIPIPLRWFVGRKRIRTVLRVAVETTKATTELTRSADGTSPKDKTDKLKYLLPEEIECPYCGEMLNRNLSIKMRQVIAVFKLLLVC